MSDLFSLENRASPAPSGAKGGIPYASSATNIGWIPHASGTKVLTQVNDNIPTWTAGPTAGGTLVTLKETFFSALTPQSIATGSTTTLDGSDYKATIAGNGAIDIVAGGLRLRQGTTGGTGYETMVITNGTTGDFASNITEPVFRRGTWALWVHLDSYNYATAAGNVVGMMEAANTRWGLRLMRNKNVNGAPNSATGGITYDYWWNGGLGSISSYGSIGVSSADVWMAYARRPDVIDFYTGTWSGGWPSMDSMTLAGSVWMRAAVQYLAASGSGMTAAPVNIQFLLGASSASSGTYEITFDGWRLTTWV